MGVVRTPVGLVIRSVRLIAAASAAGGGADVDSDPARPSQGRYLSFVGER